MERLSTLDFQAIVDAEGLHFDWPPQGRRNTMLLAARRVLSELRCTKTGWCAVAVLAIVGVYQFMR